MGRVTYNYSFFAFLPRIIRLCVFKFAILPSSTFYERFFLNRFHNNAAGQGFGGCSQNFDALRAQKTVDSFKKLGAKEHFLTPQDREAKLQVMQFKVSDIKKKIESLGGSWLKDGDRILIKGPKQETPDWKEYYETALKKLFTNEKIENGSKILITAENAGNVPFQSFWGRKTDCVLLARLGRSFAMSKLEISYFLGKGIDVCAYDTRGVLNSEGEPSEGGLYNDIEAVGDFLFQSYSPKKTCIYGSCGESFTAIHLFKKYHRLGINLFLQNAPASMGSVIKKINWIARSLFQFSGKAINAPKNSTCRNQKEDGFDSSAKIDSLNQGSGYVILAKTIGDTTAPPEEVQEMGDKLRKKGNFVSILKSDPKDSQSRPGHTDPHLAEPIRNPHLQAAIHQQIC